MAKTKEEFLQLAKTYAAQDLGRIKGGEAEVQKIILGLSADCEPHDREASKLFKELAYAYRLHDEAYMALVQHFKRRSEKGGQ